MDLLSQFDPLAVPLPDSPLGASASRLALSGAPQTPFTAALLNPYNRPRRLPLVASPTRSMGKLIDLNTPAPNVYASDKKGVRFGADFRPGDSSVISDVSSILALGVLPEDNMERRKEKKRKVVKEETHFFSSDSPPSTARKVRATEEIVVIKGPSSILKKSMSCNDYFGGESVTGLEERGEKPTEVNEWKKSSRGNKKHERSRSISVSSLSVAERYNHDTTKSPLATSVRPSSISSTPINDSTHYSISTSTFSVLNFDNDNSTGNFLMDERGSFLLDQTDLTLNSTWTPSVHSRPTSPRLITSTPLKEQQSTIKGNRIMPSSRQRQQEEDGTVRRGRIKSTVSKSGEEEVKLARRGPRRIISDEEDEEQGTIRRAKTLPSALQHGVREDGTIRSQRTLPRDPGTAQRRPQETDPGTIRAHRTLSRGMEEPGTVRRNARRPQTPCKRVQMLHVEESPPYLGSRSSGNGGSERDNLVLKSSLPKFEDAEDTMASGCETKDFKTLLEGLKGRDDTTRDIMGETLLLQDSTTTLELSALPPPPPIQSSSKSKEHLKGSRLLERIKAMKQTGEENRRQIREDILSVNQPVAALTEKALEDFLNHDMIASPPKFHPREKEKGVERWAKKTSVEGVTPSPRSSPVKARNLSPQRRPPSRQINLGSAATKENTQKTKLPVAGGISWLTRKTSRDDLGGVSTRLTLRTSTESMSAIARPLSRISTTSNSTTASYTLRRKPSIDSTTRTTRNTIRESTKLPSRKLSTDFSTIQAPRHLGRTLSVDHSSSTSARTRELNRKPSMGEFGVSRVSSNSTDAGRSPSANAPLTRIGRSVSLLSKGRDSTKISSKLPAFSGSISSTSRVTRSKKL